MIVLVSWLAITISCTLAGLYLGYAAGEGTAYTMTTRYLDRLSRTRQSEILITALIVAAGGEIRVTPVNIALMTLRDTFSKHYDPATGQEVYRHVKGVPCEPQ